MSSARSYHLKKHESAADGVRRIALGRADEALEKLRRAEGDDLASAIHGARKDLKKLRAVVRLVGSELGRSLAKAENRRYRDAGRSLSGARDAGVKLETLAALRSRLGGRLPHADCDRWREELERERDEPTREAQEGAAGQVADAIAALEAGRDRIGEWPLSADSWKLLAPGLSKSYRGGRRAMKKARSRSRPEDTHEWRKRAKDLRYQLRIVEEAWPELLGATTGQMHALTDRLGNHHDLQVLREDLSHRPGIGAEQPFEDAIEHRQAELLAEALEIGSRLYAEKPKAFGRRLERYWLAWREDRA